MSYGRIPLRCLICGNVVLTPRQEEEVGAAHIATHGCILCTPDDESNEQFYATRDGKLLSFGQWMDRIEMPGRVREFDNLDDLLGAIGSCAHCT